MKIEKCPKCERLHDLAEDCPNKAINPIPVWDESLPLDEKLRIANNLRLGFFDIMNGPEVLLSEINYTLRYLIMSFDDTELLRFLERVTYIRAWLQGQQEVRNAKKIKVSNSDRDRKLIAEAEARRKEPKVSKRGRPRKDESATNGTSAYSSVKSFSADPALDKAIKSMLPVTKDLDKTLAILRSMGMSIDEKSIRRF